MESSKTNFSVGVYFKTTRLADHALNADAVLVEQLDAALLLVGVAENADEDDGGFEVAGHIHVVDGNQAAFVDVKFAADGLADFALQQFAHPFMSQIVHNFV